MNYSRNNGDCRPDREIGFTLIELLAVIGIIALLLVTTIPYFIGLGRGTAVRSAISEVSSTLSLARQWAIAHREIAYVIFKDNITSPTNSTNYKSFAVCTTNRFISEWRTLPDGVVFDPIAKTNNLWSTSKWVHIDGKPYQYIGFKPNGSLTISKQTEIFLTEGRYETSLVFSVKRQLFGIDIFYATGLHGIREYDYYW